MQHTFEVVSIDDTAIWVSDVTDPNTDTVDTAMCGLWNCNEGDSIWGALESVMVLYAHLGFEPHRQNVDAHIGRKPYMAPIAVADAVYDLVCTLDLPDIPNCQGDVDDCPCHGCQLTARIYSTLDDYFRVTDVDSFR